MSVPSNPTSFFDRLCQKPEDPSLPSFFHLPLQQYALSGAEVDRMLSEEEQALWRSSVLLSYTLNKRAHKFFTDPFIPSFVSPDLAAWLSGLVQEEGNLPISRLMQLVNKYISPYDRIYDLNNARGVRRFLLDMVTTLEAVEGMPAIVHPDAVFDVLNAKAVNLAEPEEASFTLTYGMAHVWRVMLKQVPFDPSNPVRRADFLFHFFRLFTAAKLDIRLVSKDLLSYLNTVRYPSGQAGIGITHAMVEVFRLAGLAENETWRNPDFVQTMAQQFFAQAMPTLVLPKEAAACHQAMAQKMGMNATAQILEDSALQQSQLHFAWKKPTPLPSDARMALANIIECDEISGQVNGLELRMLRSFKECGVRFSYVPTARAARNQTNSKITSAPNKPIAPINLAACPLDRFCDFALRAGLDVFEGRYTIAYASWGTTKLPKTYHVALKLLDEVWVPSAAQQHLFAKATNAPVRVLPLPINMREGAPTLSRNVLDLPQDLFLFLTGFDAMDWMSRKNPIAVLHAFQKAFQGNEKVGLIIKTRNIARSQDTREEGHLRRMQKIWRKDPRMFVIHDEYTDDEMAALYALSDAYVSLPRATAFNAMVAEALYRSKPVITSSDIGNMDYLNADNAYLVPTTPCSVVFDAYHFLDKEIGHNWQDPDSDKAAKAMRMVYENQNQAQAKARLGQAVVAARYSDAACGAQMRQRLDAILAGLQKEQAA